MQVIKCRQCGITKPVFDFYKSKNTTTGFLAHCKSCFRLNRKNNKGKLPGVRTKTPDEYFWERVDKTGDCWVWKGTVEAADNQPRAQYTENGSTVRRSARQLAYQIQIAPVPKGNVIVGKCDNPLCVRGDHLEAITYSEKQRRIHRPANAEQLRKEAIISHEEKPKKKLFKKIVEKLWHS